MPLEPGIYYILDGHEPVRVGNVMDWAEWFETHDRRVALTETEKGTVSTVFLALDHQYGNGPPILFETMVFGGQSSSNTDRFQRRYSTWDEAVQGHAETVAALNGDLND